MFAYNPTVNDNRDQYIMAAANTQAQTMQGIGQNIAGALQSIGSMYAENKGMEAMATGYDKVAEILGSSMFKDNPAVSGYLTELRKMKNNKAKITGYQTLFSMAGPISNSQMAQNRTQQSYAAPYNRAVIDNAQDVVNQGGSGAVGATRRIPQGL